MDVMPPRGFFLNAFWNLLGSVLPLGAGLVAIPLLTKALGVERFGLLNLAWLLVGYFSLFDFGMARALTKSVAEHVAAGNLDKIPNIVHSALGLLRWLGLAATLALAAASPWIVDWLNISAAVRDETRVALLALAISLPFVLLSAGWRGVLEAYGRFDLSNWIRIPLGIAIFVFPLLVLPFAQGLLPVVLSLAVVRVAGWWLSRHLCRRINPALCGQRTMDYAVMRPLLKFGGWMTVSNVIGPLMVYADRFLIGGWLSAVAVAYYATPYEIVTRLWVLSSAVTGVIFPIIAGRIGTDRQGASTFYRESMKCVILAMLPVVAVLYLFAYEGLDWWLGPEFAKNGYLLTQILVIGVFINALGQVAITVLHGSGRADWAAKLHLAELPFYLAILIFAVSRHGIVGVALAWLLRVCADTLIVLLLAERLLIPEKRFVAKIAGLIAIVAALLWFASSSGETSIRLFILCLLLLACGILLPKQMRRLGGTTNGAVSYSRGGECQ